LTGSDAVFILRPPAGSRIVRSVLTSLVEQVAQAGIFDANARHMACEAVLDLVTAVAAAPRREFGPALRAAHGPGPSALWLGGGTAAPVAAGMANALAAAALDLDDGHRPSRGHPGACVIPAVLAEADRLDACGEAPDDEDILDAIVAGYEVGLRIAAARGFYARTGFWGGFAAAGAAGWLNRLRPEHLAHALAVAGETAPHMATTTAPPAWPQPTGSDVKEGIPWGVAAGLTAVHLARAGMTGPLDLVDHAPFFDGKSILADRPGPMIGEAYTKFHAACRHVHAPVEAFSALQARHGLAAEAIDGIEVLAYSGALRISNHVRPRTLVEAQYSIPYCLGLVATRGPQALLPMTVADIGLEQAEALAARVTLDADPACEARFPKETPAVVRVRARDEIFESPVTTPTGEADRRPSWSDRLAKFRTATRDSLAPADTAGFETAFEALQDGRLGPLRQVLVRRAEPPQ
jgi:2-methylcitrate dehydratase PrpD